MPNLEKVAFTNFSSPYNLTVDCFPFGSFAAIEIEGAIKTLLPLTVNDKPIPSLTERTYFAVDRAYELLGTPPKKITVVCIDDGGDGSELEDLQHIFNCSVDQGLTKNSETFLTKPIGSAQRVSKVALKQ